MFFKIPGCIFLSSSISPMLQHNSVFWMDWERIGVHYHHPRQMRKTGPHSHNLIFLCGRSLMPSSWHWAIVPWSRADAGNLKLFLIPSSMHQISGFCFIHFFAPTLCWITITKILNFQKVTLIQEFLSILVSFWRKTVGNSYFDIFLMTSGPRSSEKNRIKLWKIKM